MNNKLYQIDKIYRKTLIQYKFDNISLKLSKDTLLTTTINDNNYLYEGYLMKLGKFGIKLYVVLYHNDFINSLMIYIKLKNLRCIINK